MMKNHQKLEVNVKKFHQIKTVGNINIWIMTRWNASPVIIHVLNVQKIHVFIKCDHDMVDHIRDVLKKVDPSPRSVRLIIDYDPIAIL